MPPQMNVPSIGQTPPPVGQIVPQKIPIPTQVSPSPVPQAPPQVSAPLPQTLQPPAPEAKPQIKPEVTAQPTAQMVPQMSPPAPPPPAQVMNPSPAPISPTIAPPPPQIIPVQPSIQPANISSQPDKQAPVNSSMASMVRSAPTTMVPPSSQVPPPVNASQSDFDFTGRYKQVKTENWDEFLKRLGVGNFKRRILKRMKPDLKITKSGDYYTLQHVLPLKSSQIRFKFGEEFKERRAVDGVHVKSVITRDGMNKWVQKQVGPQTVEILREWDGDNLKVKGTVDGVTYYKDYKKQKIKPRRKFLGVLDLGLLTNYYD